MNAIKKEIVIGWITSATLHVLLLILISYYISYSIVDKDEAVTFVELVNPFKDSEEQENSTGIAQSSIKAEEVLERSVDDTRKKIDQALNSQTSKSLPAPLSTPKPVSKRAENKKVIQEKLPVQKATIKQQEYAEQSINESTQSESNVPLNLTPSLESVNQWDKKRKASSNIQNSGSLDPIDLNTKSAKFGDYFSQVKQRVTWSWTYPQQAKNSGLSGNVDVVFTLNQEGRVIDIKVTRSSHVEILDYEAVNAIQKASPFGPLPENWQLDKMVIKSTFEYILTNSGMRIIK
ncbi:energy transducer TonB [Candidatus Magnetaquicoccus inordinatus]|uniref:energy transducer TonB n=1 Tax=Candidatus Magnetaquicoccus inordinatus TaxID=2496818 RepID=UPI00102B259C|nr:energy transducer TonB [Candidatus Magnetaquicoccus inordinatus]